MIIGWKEGTERAIHQSRNQYLVVTRLALALGKSAGETASSAVLLAVVYLQGHKICTRNCVLSCTNSCEKHGVAHTEDSGTVSLFCNLSGLN